MKYLKLYEELNVETYINAFFDLHEKGYKDRAYKILYHGLKDKIEELLSGVFPDPTWSDSEFVKIDDGGDKYFFMHIFDKTVFIADNYATEDILDLLRFEYDLEVLDIYELIRMGIKDRLDMDLPYRKTVNFDRRFKTKL